MKMILLACVVAGLVGCSTTPRVSSSGAWGVGDWYYKEGSKPERAIVLTGRLDGDSIQALEKEWIDKHYPEASITVKVISKSRTQKLEHVRIVLPDLTTRDIFFDITAADDRYPVKGQVIQAKPKP